MSIIPLLLPSLYPILDSRLLCCAGRARERHLRTLIQELLAAGVTLVQYRNKTGRESEILQDAKVLRAFVPQGQCLLILNDYPALAIVAGFDGVHVGQEDVSVDEARRIVGVERIVGVSTHNRQQLSAAALTSADYVAIGPVFPTISKEKADPVVELGGVRLARELTHKPLVAIGGISVENCASVVEAGADSVAVISSLFANASGQGAGKIASDFFRNLR